MSDIPFMIQTLAGSRACGLEGDTSDYDFAMIVRNDEAKLDFPLNGYCLVKDESGRVDYFIDDLTNMINPHYMTGCLIVSHYAPENIIKIGAHPKLGNFIRENGVAMMDMAPVYTYANTLSQARLSLDIGSLILATRLIGTMLTCVETGSIYQSYKLNDFWRDRYYKVIAGEYGKEDVSSWYYKDLIDPSVVSFFKGLPNNTELIESYQEVITEVLMEDPVC